MNGVKPSASHGRQKPKLDEPDAGNMPPEDERSSALCGERIPFASGLQL
jgi:hypothetical protein